MLWWWQKSNTIPLADDDAAIPSSEFVPHTDAFNKIFGASVYRLRTLGALFAIVNPPAHGLHDDSSRGGVLGVRLCTGVSSDDWSIGVWSDVVARLFCRE